MGPPRLLIVGNSVLDLIGKTPDTLPKFGELAAGRGPADIDLGGNGARAAAAASVLGANVMLASTVGKDPWGKWLREQIEVRGVDTSQLITLSKVPTATTLSLVRPDGERALLTHNGASEAHDLDSIDLEAVSEGDWVLIGSLFLVEAYSGEKLSTFVEKVKARGGKVAMDLAWDCTGTWDAVSLSLEMADIVLGNELELKATACTKDLDTAIERVAAKGVDNLVIKMGAEGARIVRKGVDSHVNIPAPPVEAMNATGTGDVFNAALMIGLGEGMELEEAVTFACAAGALRVSNGCNYFPTREEIEDLLEKGM
jgi:ribokinase